MTNINSKILKLYTRAVMHMREQKSTNRFGLIFGAGIGRDFGFPKWQELIERIAQDKRVVGKSIAKKYGSKTSVSQLLFQNYKANALKTLPANYDEYNRLSSYLQAGWHRIVHDALYRDVPNNMDDIKKRDPYINEFLNIIKNTKLTVTYNFDNTIEMLLSESRTKEERKRTRGFRTVWDSDLQLYSQNAVIYHPNGYLPKDLKDRPSDDLIFLEDSFGDQLIDSISGHYAALSYHFSQNTCLFVGLSLEDSTLKHLLRKSAKLHPGHVHYYIHYLKDNETIGSEQQKAIRDANFEVYNLVTLFLNKKEIGALGHLLTRTEEEIDFLTDDLGVRPIYRYFLTGSVSVGKSTAVSHFRSLRTHDEWLERRVLGMDKDPKKVADISIIKEIDEWVVMQWRKKNFNLTREKTGIHIVDRSPLDAFAFTPEEEWIIKATFTRENITPKGSSVKLCKGKVILLIGDPAVMAVRAMKIHKDVDPENSSNRQALFRIIYNSSIDGIVEVDTREKSIGHVAKDICRIIHLEEYSEIDLQKRLEKIESGEVSPLGIEQSNKIEAEV